MPAYFWMYNLYALERNSWKALDRDKRVIKVQHIETDYLAPDTAEEIIAALAQMETWMKAANMDVSATPSLMPAEGSGQPDGCLEEEDPEYAYIPDPGEEIPAPGLERHKRRTALLKPQKARAAYLEMLRFYAAKTLIAYMESRPDLSFDGLAAEMEGSEVRGTACNRITNWINLGGQIVPAFRLDELRERIREGNIESWEAIHRVYDEFRARYPLDKARHAWGVLKYLQGNEPDAGAFARELDHALETRRWITDQVYRSRAKDFNDPFRNITYRNKEEMDQVVGKAEDTYFVNLARKNLARFEETVTVLKGRLL
jgi:hypothetical protein